MSIVVIEQYFLEAPLASFYGTGPSGNIHNKFNSIYCRLALNLNSNGFSDNLRSTYCSRIVCFIQIYRWLRRLKLHLVYHLVQTIFRCLVAKILWEVQQMLLVVLFHMTVHFHALYLVLVYPGINSKVFSVLNQGRVVCSRLFILCSTFFTVYTRIQINLITEFLPTRSFAGN